ncbi:MAG: membrane protein insertion efficiency factor YidD [Clostridia bacterium]|nr:membrane protein insertion efficiency factor YidD [Clostridia bacterium]
MALYYAANLKDAAICCVKIYQRYAPAAIRNRCRFEPSCSEYMILSLEKYGLFKGLKKGFNRMHRCNANDGGYDYP